jgi:response regulator RpfG family c-di-GMP phosphodiesterase
MARHSILLVDNEMLSRDLLTNHLKHSGLKVFNAAGAAEAETLLAQNRFFLAILNIKIGDKATAGLISRLHEAERDVLVFLLDSQPGTMDAETLGRMGAFDTIVKPFRLEDVKIKLSHALEILDLRLSLRRQAERLRRLEQKIRRFESIEEKVRIPDLSELEQVLEKEETGGKGKNAGREEIKDVPGSLVESSYRRQQVSTFDVDYIEQIRKLGDLLKAGMLTEQEFNSKKKELLSRL